MDWLIFVAVALSVFAAMLAIIVVIEWRKKIRYVHSLQTEAFAAIVKARENSKHFREEKRVLVAKQSEFLVFQQQLVERMHAACADLIEKSRIRLGIPLDAEAETMQVLRRCIQANQLILKDQPDEALGSIRKQQVRIVQVAEAAADRAAIRQKLSVLQSRLERRAEENERALGLFEAAYEPTLRKLSAPLQEEIAAIIKFMPTMFQAAALRLADAHAKSESGDDFMPALGDAATALSHLVDIDDGLRLVAKALGGPLPRPSSTN